MASSCRSLADEAEVVPIPGEAYASVYLSTPKPWRSSALRRHRRRVIRVHLGTDVIEGMEALLQAVNEAL